MYTILGNPNVELYKEVGKIDTPKIALGKNIDVFKSTSLEEYFTDRKT